MMKLNFTLNAIFQGWMDSGGGLPKNSATWFLKCLFILRSLIIIVIDIIIIIKSIDGNGDDDGKEDGCDGCDGDGIIVICPYIMIIITNIK